MEHREAAGRKPRRQKLFAGREVGRPGFRIVDINEGFPANFPNSEAAGSDFLIDCASTDPKDRCELGNVDHPARRAIAFDGHYRAPLLSAG